jgi:hypothetical protein
MSSSTCSRARKFVCTWPPGNWNWPVPPTARCAGALLPAQPRWSNVEQAIYQDERLCPLCRAIIDAQRRGWNPDLAGARHRRVSRRAYSRRSPCVRVQSRLFKPPVYPRIPRMLSRIPAFARCLSLAALCAAGPVSALEFPLPPPGEDIIGSVQTVTAKYEDTFADLGTQYDLGYLEMIAANPGVDAWLPGRRHPGHPADPLHPAAGPA